MVLIIVGCGMLKVFIWVFDFVMLMCEGLVFFNMWECSLFNGKVGLGLIFLLGVIFLCFIM